MYPLPTLVVLVALVCHGTARSASGASVFQQPLITYRDANIAVEQLVGSPPQKLRLKVDLASNVNGNSGQNGTTRIASACCAKCCNQRRFAPWQSSSFRETSTNGYLDIHGEDVIQFPSSVGDQMTISTPLELTNVDRTLTDEDKHLDGYASFAYRGSNSTFADVLFNHMKPQFAIHTRRTCNDSYAVAGSIAYGTLENDSCNAFRFRAMKPNDFGEVRLSLQKLSLGEVVVDGQQSGSALLWSEHAIAVPEAAFDKLNATLHASGGFFDIHYVDCSLNPGPLTFTFGELGVDGVTYDIPFSQLITNVDGVCQLNVILSSDTFMIGLPFLREYCVAVDYENKQVGFATHQRSVTSECKYTAEPKPSQCPDKVPGECRATPSTRSTTSQATTPAVARSPTTTAKSGTRSSSYLLFALTTIVITVLVSMK